MTAFWFTADTDLTIDVCTPLAVSGDNWSFVDMELDLFGAADGRAGIVDEDEWGALVCSGLITEPVIRAVPQSAKALLPLVIDGVEPFGSAGRVWLQRLTGQPE